MDIKILKIAGVLALLILLYACPKEDCGFVTKNAFVPDLMTISPFQGTYHVGDEIICSITINSANDYFYGGNVDIFDETNINNVNICDCELHKLFENNQFTIIEGDYSNFKPVMKYFPNENEYRFKALIKFTKIA
ncbi:MAG: hypothetical protein U1C46_04660, partial [Bacteroidales bacterium]|nr:hypothetical protein [Bacteroidales bacterium]